jgi:hypothetical protein
MNDQDLITAVRQSVHGVRMNVPAEQIVSRSRAIRTRGHRRLATGVLSIAAAGSAVLGLVLSGTFRAAPNDGSGTIRTAAFTLTRNANGTDTLTLSMNQMFDPATLQQALRHDGIPALVKINTRCSSDPAPASPAGLGVLSVELPDGTPVPPSSPIPAHAVNVIRPSAIPAGTELFFGFFDADHSIAFGLIDTKSYTCS